MSKYQFRESDIYLPGTDIPRNRLEMEDPDLLHEVNNSAHGGIGAHVRAPLPMHEHIPPSTDVRRRRSIRLQGYDYSQAGAYFVTACAHNRECLFGSIENGIVTLCECGGIVQTEWIKTAEIRSEVTLDAFVVMPNHFHAILFIDNGSVGAQVVVAHTAVGAHGRAPLQRSPKSLGSLMAGFKSAATKRINETRNSPGIPVWQRNYYERVIRNEEELNAIRQYIIDNPARWTEDRNHPANIGMARAHGRASQPEDNA
jgi:REP element-mobilizing transposase RayT